MYIAAEDPSNVKVLDIFTGPRIGRLVAPPAALGMYKNNSGDCARSCADMPSTDCQSFNYDFLSGNCELLNGIQGSEYSLSESALNRHYERLGGGNIYRFMYTNLTLHHNVTYYLNFHMVNYLGYENYISSDAVMLDLTSPEPGELISHKYE